MYKKSLILALFLVVSISFLLASQAEFAPSQKGESEISDIAPTTPIPSIPLFRSDTLMYENGSFTGGLGITGSSTPDSNTQIGFATYFSLSEFGITEPRAAGTILMNFQGVNGTDYRIFLWDNAGPGLTPNSHGTHLYADFALPLPTPNTWQAIDVSSAGILPDTFWVGYTYNALVPSPADWYIYYDGNTVDDHTYGNLSGGPSDWTEMGNYGYGYAYACRMIVEEVAAGDTFTWDFETGPQGWTHTNGVPHPGGWGVVDSAYTASSYVVGVAGDSCMNLDAYVGGPISDTALSPVFDEFTDTYLHWGMNYQNYAGYDTVAIIARTHDGSSWSAWVGLTGYGSDMGLFWDSIDVSGIAGESLQIGWVWEDFGYTSGWFASFDEVGPVLLFEQPDVHDVGASAFLSPPTLIAPGNLDVIGEVRNWGDFDENYDVHCVVQDPTDAIVLDTTINVTTAIGERDTITFGQVSFQHGYTYDLMMATLLAGDENPANDTTTQQTVCTAALWEILPSMPYTTSGPYVGYHVENGTTYVHIFGGNPGPQNNHYILNYSTGTYATGTPLPMGSSYGGTVSFDNMIYLCGAWNGFSDQLYIYDCINDTYTGRTLPGGARANPTVVSKDNRYVYVIGGYPSAWQGGTAVDVYDAIADTFFGSPTQLPASCACMSSAGALIAGDTILVAAGYHTSSAVDRVFYGAIDPVDPGTITWAIHGTTYPAGATYRLGGSDWDGIGYFTAGSSALTNTYSYEAGIGWLTLPDKPTGCMNVGWVMAPADTSTFAEDSEIIGFAMGGYSPYMDIGEAYHTGNIVASILEKPNEGIGQFSCKLISSNPVSLGNAYIQLVMPTKGAVNFSVYDVTGRRVLSRDFSQINAGTHTIRWESKNNQGTPVAAGTYFYRVTSAENIATGKIVIVK